MSYLLDTHAVTEPSRPVPDVGLLSWMRRQDEADLFVSVVTFGELRRGAVLLPSGPKRGRFERAHRQALRWYASTILELDLKVFVVWGELSARHRLAGVAPGMSDELIAATALVHDLTVVTRNAADFQHAGCRVLSPWTA